MKRLLPRTPASRAGLALVAVVIGLNLMIVVIDALAPTPGGQPSSSFATAERGLAAWADLLRRERRQVRALRRDPSKGGLPASGTIVVLDAPGLPREDLRALERFAERGGHLVVGGRDGDELATFFLDDAPRWSRGGGRDPRTLVPVAETRGVANVRTAGEGQWDQAGEGLPVLGSGEGDALLVVARTGRGRVSMLADASPLQNRLLGKADNAALALALAGSGPVAFLETPHGYGEARGLAALPRNAKWALGLLVAAALLFMAARGRRMGPPEIVERPLAPPRVAYVESLGALLARKPDAAALGERVRRAALARLRVDPDDAEGVAERGRAAGLDEAEVAVLAAPATDPDAAILAGRALAKLEARAAGPTGRIA